jgi:hypothetical protein
MSSFRFFSLLYKLRLKVYDQIAADMPHHTAMIKYSGLYLSCHKIKREFDTEYTKVANNLIRKNYLGIYGPLHLTMRTKLPSII